MEKQFQLSLIIHNQSVCCLTSHIAMNLNLECLHEIFDTGDQLSVYDIHFYSFSFIKHIFRVIAKSQVHSCCALMIKKIVMTLVNNNNKKIHAFIKVSVLMQAIK